MLPSNTSLLIDGLVFLIIQRRFIAFCSLLMVSFFCSHIFLCSYKRYYINKRQHHVKQMNASQYCCFTWFQQRVSLHLINCLKWHTIAVTNTEIRAQTCCATYLSSQERQITVQQLWLAYRGKDKYSWEGCSLLAESSHWFRPNGQLINSALNCILKHNLLAKVITVANKHPHQKKKKKTPNPNPLRHWNLYCPGIPDQPINLTLLYSLLLIEWPMCSI